MTSPGRCRTERVGAIGDKVARARHCVPLLACDSAYLLSTQERLAETASAIDGYSRGACKPDQPNGGR